MLKIQNISPFFKGHINDFIFPDKNSMISTKNPDESIRTGDIFVACTYNKNIFNQTERKSEAFKLYQVKKSDKAVAICKNSKGEGKALVLSGDMEIYPLNKYIDKIDCEFKHPDFDVKSLNDEKSRLMEEWLNLSILA